MKLGLYQSHPEFGQVERNVRQAVNDLKEVDADLMVLPELFNTGYQFVSREETLDLAEDMPSGMTCETLTVLAKSKGMYLVFGMAIQASLFGGILGLSW